MALFWLFFAIAMVAAEVVTTAFFAVFVAAGGLAAMGFALYSDNVWGQIATFAVVAVAGAFLARPVLVHRFESKEPVPVLPGVQQLVGQTAIVVDPVGDEHHSGHVRIAGENWLAVTDPTASRLPAETPVVIVAVRGTTLLVRPTNIGTPGVPPAAPPESAAT